jgi:MFS family permease
MSESDFLDWGWRVPFYLSGLLIVIGLLIRLRILETPLFAAVQAQNQVAADPIRETIQRHGREILLVAGSRFVENASFYLFTAYAIAYGRDVLGIRAGVLLGAVNVAAALAFFTIPFFGFVSDRWSRRSAYIVGCWFMILFAFPFYYLLHTRVTGWIHVAIILGLSVGHALLYSVQAAMIPERFGTRLRCTAASLGYQLAGPLAGGLAPLIAATLVKFFPGHYWPLSVYIILLGVISLLSVHRLAETGKKELDE